MREDEVWQVIDEERASMADLFDDLTPAEWETPSLCDGWRVRRRRRPPDPRAVRPAPRSVGVREIPGRLRPHDPRHRACGGPAAGRALRGGAAGDGRVPAQSPRHHLSGTADRRARPWPGHRPPAAPDPGDAGRGGEGRRHPCVDDGPALPRAAGSGGLAPGGDGLRVGGGGRGAGTRADRRAVAAGHRAGSGLRRAPGGGSEPPDDHARPDTEDLPDRLALERRTSGGVASDRTADRLGGGELRIFVNPGTGKAIFRVRSPRHRLQEIYFVKALGCCKNFQRPNTTNLNDRRRATPTHAESPRAGAQLLRKPVARHKQQWVAVADPADQGPTQEVRRMRPRVNGSSGSGGGSPGRRGG